MNTTQQLHDLGQSVWLDNITRELLQNGTLQNYIDNYNVTGLTSNPTIYEQAIRHSHFYDEEIKEKATEGKTNSEIFFELAIEDLRQAADLFAPIHKATSGVDGWVSLEISPLLANDVNATISEAIRLHESAQRENLFIKIPGTPSGCIAIEEVIFAGVPVNVTLLFSCEQYMKAGSAYMRAIERRIAAGLNPKVASVASLFVSRWDVAVKDKVPADLHNKLGIAIAQRTYRAYQHLLDSPRWLDLAKAGAQTQRLLWASTGSKDSAISDTFYVQELASPNTINTLPEKTLLTFGDHGLIGHTMSVDGDNAEQEIALFMKAGIDIDLLAGQLQTEGTASFTKSWNELLAMINSKSVTLANGEAEKQQPTPTIPTEPTAPSRPTLRLKKYSKELT
ncbi:transaldolase [Solimicrobium silvestre]|uniref:Transaldolase n=1 Tax=Solimicrobium silvestre TaxID=2099400 RepID=A0A2S9GTN8_9BURK|nr:transaldolase [Solimicrobium silvestre]PRC91056.1 Transaldolase [Solimicrobium silvestre]